MFILFCLTSIVFQVNFAVAETSPLTSRELGCYLGDCLHNNIKILFNSDEVVGEKRIQLENYVNDEKAVLIKNSGNCSYQGGIHKQEVVLKLDPEKCGDYDLKVRYDQYFFVTYDGRRSYGDGKEIANLVFPEAIKEFLMKKYHNWIKQTAGDSADANDCENYVSRLIKFNQHLEERLQPYYKNSRG